MTDLCLSCGKVTKISRKHVWKKLTLKDKLCFWRTTHIGYCMTCWLKAMLQIHELFKEEKDRFEIYLRMCEE